MRARRLASMIALVGAFAVRPAARAQDRTPPPEEITQKAAAAITKGLDGLARHQSGSGALPGSVPVAATSMACLAFMAEGSTPYEGKYAANIRRGLRYIRKCCGSTGFITDNMQSGMYGHGFATLFLAEALGMIHDRDESDETREALTRAVRLLEHAQNCFGGWNMTPDGKARDDGSGAVAIMQITALRAARNAGLLVSGETIRKAKKYLLEMTSNDGWYAYNYNARGSSNPSPATTGAGMYMLGAMDLYGDAKYEKGIANLMKSAPFLNKGGALSSWGGWWPYTAFYASLAIYQHGGEQWRKWYPAIRDELVKLQGSDGGWPNEPYGGLFNAFCVLVLELPYRILPIFQDGGPGAEGSTHR